MEASSSSSGGSKTLSCNDPGFIASFFAASRLHHLSTWKAELSDSVMNHMLSNKTLYKASQPGDSYRTIMHVDMDCFFASVGLRDKPHLADKPVAVAHSAGSGQASSGQGFCSSEIASCNYKAREKGLSNGMYMGTARKLAPDLVVIPYDFEAYDRCCKEIYRIFFKEANYVQAVSCDEAYIDVTFLLLTQVHEHLRTHPHEPPHVAHETEARLFAERLRNLIFEATRCPASVGISHNLLLARMATIKAKPNGVFFISATNQHDVLRSMSIESLPGFGSQIGEKCEQAGLSLLGEACAKSLPHLQSLLGNKTGQQLHQYALGQDDRVLENKPRQTIGSEISWGIRFSSHEEVRQFISRLSQEVFSRLQGYTAYAVTVNLKRKLYDGEPVKFLGHGHCEDLSRCVQVHRGVRSLEQLKEIVTELVDKMALKPTDIRGIGIHCKKLQVNLSGGEGGGKAGGIESFLKAASLQSHSTSISGHLNTNSLGDKGADEEGYEEGGVEEKAVAVKEESKKSNRGGQSSITNFTRKQTLSAISSSSLHSSGEVETTVGVAVVKSEGKTSNPLLTAFSKITPKIASSSASITNATLTPVATVETKQEKIARKRSIGSFFQTQTEEEGGKGDVLNEVDMSVWYSLPEDIRREQLIMLKRLKGR